MKVVGYRELALDQLVLDGDFKQRLNAPRVFELAKSVARTDGPISEPGVHWKTKAVLYGRDRIAASMRAGKTHIMCKLWDVTPEEASELEMVENCHRRHDAEKANREVATMLDMYEKQARDLGGNFPVKAISLSGANRGGAKTARGVARARVAAELGITPESVRRREQRIKRAEDDRKYKAKHKPKGVTPQVTTIGMEVTDEFAEATNELRKLLLSVAATMTSVQKTFGRIKREKLPFNPAHLQRLYDDAHALGAAARLALPVALCPYCKGLSGIQENCVACGQSAWINSAQYDAVPKELWQEGDQMMVAYQGRFVSVADVLDTPSTPAFPEQRVEDDLSEIFP